MKGLDKFSWRRETELLSKKQPAEANETFGVGKVYFFFFLPFSETSVNPQN